MVNPKIVRCIYCNECRRASKEHVLQASLGGNLTIEDVCVTCNTGFSKIDQALAERSLLALWRVGVTAPGGMDVQLGGDHFWEEPAGVWNDIKIVNGLKPIVLPQIHLFSLDSEARLGLTGGDKLGLDAFLALVGRKVADGSILSVYVKVGPGNRCSTTRLVGYRTDALYVRTKDEQAGRGLLKLISEKWTAFMAAHAAAPPRALEVRNNPSVQITQSICLDDNYRAVAKVAFNVLAVRKGADFVRRAEFDPIRSYIRGMDLVHQDPLPADEIAVDTRFVRQVPSDEKPLIPTEAHAVAFHYDAPVLYALVTLYRTSSFVVRLGEVELDDPVIIDGHEFSTDRSVNRILGLTDLARRLWESSRGQPETA